MAPSRARAAGVKNEHCQRIAGNAPQFRIGDRYLQCGNCRAIAIEIAVHTIASIVNPHELGGTKVQTSQQPIQPAPRDRWIDLKALEQLCCVKKSTIYSLLRDKQSNFPHPVRLSARMVRWSENEVHQWMQARVAAGHVNGQRETASNVTRPAPGVTRHTLRG